MIGSDKTSTARGGLSIERPTGVAPRALTARPPWTSRFLFFEGSDVMDTAEAVGRLLDVAHTAYSLRLVTATAGNVSVRTGEGFMISGSGYSLGWLEEKHLATVKHDGQHTAGPTPSLETSLHAAVYRSIKEAGSILHFHGLWTPQVAIMDTLDPWVPSVCSPDFAALFPDPGIPRVPALAAGSVELVNATLRALARQPRGILLCGHGAVTWGANSREALFAAEIIEMAAHTDYHARCLNQPGGCGYS